MTVSFDPWVEGLTLAHKRPRLVKLELSPSSCPASGSGLCLRCVERRAWAVRLCSSANGLVTGGINDLRMLGEPSVEIGVFPEDKVEGLSDDMIDVGGAEKFGVTLHFERQRFPNADMILALGDDWRGSFEKRHKSFVLLSQPESAVTIVISWYQKLVRIRYQGLVKARRDKNPKIP